MDIEMFILSVRERRPVWDQQLPEHHNRYILDRLWKEISKENNCSVKEAQKKWKGLRDYYRSEFRKTQKERSGQGADTVYSPQWPYFITLDFLKQQFQARPSSGNIKHRSEKRKADDPAETAEESDINPDSPNELAEDNGTGKSLSEDVSATANTTSQNESTNSARNIPAVAESSTRSENRAFTHSNDFPKKKVRHDQIQRLVQLEEKKVAILEEKKKKQEKEKNEPTDDEDLKFFESLKPHLKLITGINKLMFRNDVQHLVMKYAYSGQMNSSSNSTPASGHASAYESRTSTPHFETPYNLPNPDDVASAEADNVSDEWNRSLHYF